MYDLITTSDINSLISLNATFLALLHAGLTIYSTVDGQDLRKIANLPQRFSLRLLVPPYLLCFNDQIITDQGKSPNRAK